MCAVMWVTEENGKGIGEEEINLGCMTRHYIEMTGNNRRVLGKDFVAEGRYQCISMRSQRRDFGEVSHGAGQKEA